MFKQTEYGIEEARPQLGNLLARVVNGGETITLTRSGKPAAALVPIGETGEAILDMLITEYAYASRNSNRDVQPELWPAMLTIAQHVYGCDREDAIERLSEEVTDRQVADHDRWLAETGGQ